MNLASFFEPIAWKSTSKNHLCWNHWLNELLCCCLGESVCDLFHSCSTCWKFLPPSLFVYVYVRLFLLHVTPNLNWLWIVMCVFDIESGRNYLCVCKNYFWKQGWNEKWREVLFSYMFVYDCVFDCLEKKRIKGISCEDERRRIRLKKRECGCEFRKLGLECLSVLTCLLYLCSISCVRALLLSCAPSSWAVRSVI